MEIDAGTFEDVKSRGLIIAYRPGDIVHLRVRLDSDLVSTRTPSLKDIEVEVLQPIWLYSSPNGLLLSTDGSTFRPWKDAMGGHVSFGVGLDGAAGRNSASLEVSGRLKR